ncbi:MAG: CGNR zinc finger domain-containing protein [Actinomycetota bacterium]|nr:CGNR zinc finger domain-containing protein [Actinomycetota bacterium]
MSHTKQQQAPGDLELVRGFVNTVDVEDGRDALADPQGLAAWLREHELLEPRAEVGKSDLRRAVAVREALRAQLLANNGGEPDPDAVATLHEAAGRAGIALRFSERGSELEPSAGGVDGALGRLLTIVHRAEQDGTWRRLKACPWHTCHWAFYDNTKNRSGVWCTMEVCGNRAKAKAYRERRAAAARR